MEVHIPIKLANGQVCMIVLSEKEVSELSPERINQLVKRIESLFAPRGVLKSIRISKPPISLFEPTKPEPTKLLDRIVEYDKESLPHLLTDTNRLRLKDAVLAVIRAWKIQEGPTLSDISKTLGVWRYPFSNSGLRSTLSKLPSRYVMRSSEKPPRYKLTRNGISYIDGVLMSMLEEKKGRANK